MAKFAERTKPLGRKSVERTCDFCGWKFFAFSVHVKTGHGKFCSKKCHYEFAAAHSLRTFWKDVDKHGPMWNGTPCWIWTGMKGSGGYGIKAVRHKNKVAHRVSWQLLRGEIPPGLTLDHLCLRPSCVNPDHLEVVTRGENTARANRRRAKVYQGGSR